MVRFALHTEMVATLSAFRLGPESIVPGLFLRLRCRDIYHFLLQFSFCSLMILERYNEAVCCVQLPAKGKCRIKCTG